MNDLTQTSRIPNAVYGVPELEEYKNNPLISALPPIYSDKVVTTKLKLPPHFDKEEINLDGRIRVHAISRLINNFFQPLNHHLQLESKISLMIRQGYLGRNPDKTDFNKHLQNGYERIVKGDITAFVFDDVKSTANSMSLFGCSGCGKSKAMERIFAMYPQAIMHPKYNITQLVYLKLDCPHDGDLDELCLSFFTEVDKILHTRYNQTHGRKKLGTPRLMANMCQIANLHALGLLVIDEVQNLSESRSGGAKKMHNFFVSLVNTIGVPVIQIGTHKAKKFFQDTLRTARRVSGFGSLLWDRLPKDKNWHGLLKTLWQYQWLQKPEPLTDELEDTMYDLSQGVMDIVVKLFVLAQARAIVVKTERVTCKLLTKVYEDELQPVHPMLDALRSGKAERIARFDDLVMPEIELRLLSMMKSMDTVEVKNKKTVISDDKTKKLLSLLDQMGIEQDIAIPLVDSVLSEYPKLSIPALLHKVTQYTEDIDVKAEKPISIKRSNWSQLATNDLRYLYATREKESMYDVFKKQGLVFNLQQLIEHSA